MKKEQEILDTAHNWDAAIAVNDVPAMAQYMHDDWVIVGTGGGITSKETFLASIRSGEVVHTRMTTEESRVRIYADTAVITASGISEGYFKGQPFSLHEWSTSIYIRENNRWICVLTMLTPV